jgi:ubiquinone/menaquinone biosynthesis C-methylase UbiE
MTTAVAPPRAGYILGHSEHEMNRLIKQSQYFNDLTAALLRDAGLSEGMRVLDVGSGAGDVALLAAEIVGPRGMVVGVDTSPEAVALATERAASAGLRNVRFQTQDAAEVMLDAPVDALIGRLILMYFTDPAFTLRRLVSWVKPGGIVAFQEIDMAGATSWPCCPLFETVVQRITTTFTRAGCDARTGLKLPAIFRETGLPDPRLILGARVESAPHAAIYEVGVGITRTLLPVMQQTGVASAEEVGIETLAERVRDEAVALDATLVSPSLIGAWARNTAAA